jgi:hypothetical protein
MSNKPSRWPGLGVHPLPTPEQKVEHSMVEEQLRFQSGRNQLVIKPEKDLVRFSTSRPFNSASILLDGPAIDVLVQHLQSLRRSLK